MAAANKANVMEEEQGTIVRFEGSISLPVGPVLVRQNADTGEVTLSPVSEGELNPWIQFFEAMERVPRDDDWHEFMKIMQERPMNQMPVDRKIFPEED